MTWDTDTLTIAEAEALFAEPLPPASQWTEDGSYPEPYPDVFCENELLKVYRRVTAEQQAVVDAALTLDKTLQNHRNAVRIAVNPDQYTWLVPTEQRVALANAVKDLTATKP